MAAANCPKMMSSLLFYHKKENPSLASLTVRGGGLKRFCSERPGGAAATSESREPVKLCPATLSKGGESQGHGAEEERYGWTGTLSLLLCGGAYLGALPGEYPIVLPDALHVYDVP